MNEWLKACFASVQFDLMTFALVLGLIVSIWILWHVQRAANKVDLTELLIDADGKASWTKITAIGAFLISSWAFISIVQHDKMTETLFALYIAVYSGAPVAYRYIASRSPVPTDVKAGA